MKERNISIQRNLSRNEKILGNTEYKYYLIINNISFHNIDIDKKNCLNKYFFFFFFTLRAIPATPVLISEV